MALPYSGNSDFRGYLAATNPTYLNFVGNDGGIDNAALTNYLGSQGLDIGNEMFFNEAQRIKNDIGAQYSTWQADQNGVPSNYASGPSAAELAARADEQAYWDDQNAVIDQQMGRLGAQRSTADQNVLDSYTSAYNKLVNDKGVAERDYNTKRGRAVEDNITAKNDINTSVRNRLSGVQRLLGAKGSGNSSAATELVPFAAALLGSQQRGQVQKTYGRNLSDIDTSWGDYGRDWENSAGELSTQKDERLRNNKLLFDQTEAGLLEQKGNIGVQRAQAGGSRYTEARSARQPYQSRINELLGSIDSLGRTTPFTQKQVSFNAKDPEAYTYDRYATPTGGVDPGQAAQVGSFWTLLGRDKKKTV